MLQGGFNVLMQEDVMAEVLQHLSTREKLQLAPVCRLWRACVANSWTTANLSGRTTQLPDPESSLAWLAEHVPPRMLKVSSLQCCGTYDATASQAHCAS